MPTMFLKSFTFLLNILHSNKTTDMKFVCQILYYSVKKKRGKIERSKVSVVKPLYA